MTVSTTVTGGGGEAVAVVPAASTTAVPVAGEVAGDGPGAVVFGARSGEPTVATRPTRAADGSAAPLAEEPEAEIDASRPLLGPLSARVTLPSAPRYAAEPTARNRVSRRRTAALTLGTVPAAFLGNQPVQGCE